MSETLKFVPDEAKSNPSEHPAPNKKETAGKTPDVFPKAIADDLLKSGPSKELGKTLPRLEELPEEIKEAVDKAKEMMNPEYLNSLKGQAEEIGRPVDDLLASYFLKHPKYRRRDGPRV